MRGRKTIGETSRPPRSTKEAVAIGAATLGLIVGGGSVVGNAIDNDPATRLMKAQDEAAEVQKKADIKAGNDAAAGLHEIKNAEMREASAAQGGGVVGDGGPGAQPAVDNEGNPVLPIETLYGGEHAPVVQGDFPTELPETGAIIAGSPADRQHP